jgi:hypothetical protein
MLAQAWRVLCSLKGDVHRVRNGNRDDPEAAGMFRRQGDRDFPKTSRVRDEISIAFVMQSRN